MSNEKSLEEWQNLLNQATETFIELQRGINDSAQSEPNEPQD